MKKILFITMISLFCINMSYAEILKVRTSSYAIRFNNSGIWENWPIPKSTDVLIVIDTDKERVTVYSSHTQVYDIILEYGKTYDNYDHTTTWKFKCVDEDGLKCNLRMVTYNTSAGGAQIYMDYSDMQWMYNLAGY